MITLLQPSAGIEVKIHCPICARNVSGYAARAVANGKPALRARLGQHCGHCGALLDAGVVVELMPALGARRAA